MGKLVINQLDINLFYSSEWNDFTFFDILNGNGWIHTDDLEFSAFYNAQGGIELKMDRIFLFFKGSGMTDHFQAVYFLLQSLCETLNLQNDPAFELIWADNRKSEKMISLALGPNSSLNLLCDEKDKLFKIQHVSVNRRIEDKRNNPFFDEIWVDYFKWREAASVALNEYFDVIDRMFSVEVAQKVLPQYTSFFSIWDSIKQKLKQQKQ